MGHGRAETSPPRQRLAAYSKAGALPLSDRRRSPASRAGSRRRAAARQAPARSRSSRPATSRRPPSTSCPRSRSPRDRRRRQPALDRRPPRRRLARVERAREVVGVEHRRVDRRLQVRGRTRRARGRTRATTGPAGRRRACRTRARCRRRARPCDGDSVVRGRTPGASDDGSPSSSQNICARVPSANPRPSIAGEDCSQPPLGVARHEVAEAVRDVEVAGVAARRLARRRRPPCAGPPTGSAATVRRAAARRTPAAPTSARRASAYARESSSSNGTGAESPYHASRSANASFAPSTTVWTCSTPRNGPAKPVEQRELLQEHRPLAPRPGLEHRPVAEAERHGSSTVARYAARSSGVRKPDSQRLGHPAAVPGVTRGVDPRLARRAGRPRRAARRCRPASGCAAARPPAARARATSAPTTARSARSRRTIPGVAGTRRARSRSRTPHVRQLPRPEVPQQGHPRVERARHARGQTARRPGTRRSPSDR